MSFVPALLQVQEAVKCRVVDRQEDTNGDSGGSFQNGHAQLMVWISVFRIWYLLIQCSFVCFNIRCSRVVVVVGSLYICFSLSRLTLKKTLTWLADQVKPQDKYV